MNNYIISYNLDYFISIFMILYNKCSLKKIFLNKAWKFFFNGKLYKFFFGKFGENRRFFHKMKLKGV